MTTLSDHVRRPWLDEPGAPLRLSRWTALVRGRRDDARWVRPALLALLAATALLYLWGLGASGWANGFYSAAVEAGSKSWKAFFFGSFDSSNFITVDKPPASLWVMDLSARLFGVNAWSILVPQALEGVAAVGLLFATVRRIAGPVAGLIAGAVMATTPVAVLMFRFDNPDALLVLLLVASAYTTVRALETARTRWLVFTGVLIGLGFLTKMLQAFLVVPGFAVVYLVAAPTSLRRRIGQLLAGGLAILVSAGWWVAIVELWPKNSRPYIGGSQTNSVLELVFGYNGLGRLTGNETGSVGGGGGATGQWGPTGITRLFNSSFGGQASWLIPAALVLLAAGLLATARRPRGDLTRAHYGLWGSWLVVTGLTFSYAKGIIHPYYTVALAPAIGGLVGMGAVHFWHLRDRLWGRISLSLAMAAAASWSYVLLQRNTGAWQTVGSAVLVGGLVAVVVLASWTSIARLVGVESFGKRVAAVVALVALADGVTGTTAYAVQTASVTHSGAIPSAGPAVTGARGGPGGGAGGGPRGGGAFGGVQRGLRQGTPPVGGQGAGANAPGTAPAGGGFPLGGGGGGGRGGIGGLLDVSTANPALVTALQTNASAYTWVAASVGANNAAGYQLAADLPVMAIGGFNGSDPTPTLAAFQAIVAAGKVHYFIGGGGPGGGQGASGTSTEIANWVAAHYTATAIGGTTVYDLTQPAH
jgi:4-amino-4-deoxy-L-arabinose transferase-like glycosyltransferase